MILVNGEEIRFTRFPDGTTSFRYDPDSERWYLDDTVITWKYDGDHECILMWYLVNHIRSDRFPYIRLYMPYVPNARMDRVKQRDEVLTIKWFADFINSLKFGSVTILDPHSNVAPALINNVYIIQPKKYIEAAIEDIDDEDLLICYPDEGAVKRYSDLIRAEYIFGIKHRDWRSGEIERLELTSSEKVNGRNVLIVDDICSRGGTFTHTARALKEAGANNIFLYVSHCENTIFNGSVLTDGLISRIYTTDSIYRGEHEKITILQDQGEE